MTRLALAVPAIIVVLLSSACGGADGDLATSDIEQVQASAASGRQERLVVPMEGEDVLPAGIACDFAMTIGGTAVVKINRFFDVEGTLVRAIQEYAEHNRFTNDDTGAFVTEEIHYTRQVEFAYIDGQRTIVGEKVTGRTYAMRDESGRFVVTSAGRGVYEFDPDTRDEILITTPHVVADWARAVCPALGGGPPI